MALLSTSLKTARLTSRADPVERAATGRLALAQEQ